MYFHFKVLNMKTVIPPFLKEGDTIAIVAPAKFVDEQSVRNAIKKVEVLWKVNVVTGAYTFDKYYRYSSSDINRLNDLQHMIDDDRVKAIWMARGGYGSNRIMDKLDYRGLFEHPKWLVGFSDITALICDMENRGLAAIHGAMPAFLDRQNANQSLAHLKSLLFGLPEPIVASANRLNRTGEVMTSLTGGNLSILCSMLGTASFPDVSGKILVLEEVDEYLYRIDRMMVQLKRAGVFKKIAGVVIGYISDMNDNDDPFGKTAYEIISEHLDEVQGPIAFGMPIGHCEPNYSYCTLKPYILSVDIKISKLKFL
ncbi:MAG TPA: LD-carboxypeptidase [Cytophagales bacterium]|jgi:muramoyltetrapeptide carboxypeptidase|nr:LD-carboxypeptidase [Cytophagales bacterium]